MWGPRKGYRAWEESQIQLPTPVDILLKSRWMSGLYFMKLETVNPVTDYDNPKFIIKDHKKYFWQRARVATGDLSRKVMENTQQISFFPLVYLCSSRESFMRADSERDTWYSLKAAFSYALHKMYVMCTQLVCTCKTPKV